VVAVDIREPTMHALHEADVEVSSAPKPLVSLNAFRQASDASSRTGSPDELEAGRLVWKRWALFGPILISCLLVIFLAGPTDNQNMYLTAHGKALPSHRQPTLVEERRAATRRNRIVVNTWAKVTHLPSIALSMSTVRHWAIDLPHGSHHCCIRVSLCHGHVCLKLRAMKRTLLIAIIADVIAILKISLCRGITSLRT
jgi:hypothetical protein